jgi:hypothetical protein
VTGTFAATATLGNITNSGALLITGASTFTANAFDADITLDQAGNDFTGAVSFAGAGGLHDVTVNDLSAFDIRTLELTGNLVVTAGGAITTNNGPLVIGGTTNVTAHGFDITLDDVTYFSGGVYADSSGLTGIGGNIVLTSDGSFTAVIIKSDGADNAVGAGFAAGNITFDAGVGHIVFIGGGGTITAIGGDSLSGAAGGNGGNATFLVDAYVDGTTFNLSGGLGTPNGVTGTLTFFDVILDGTSNYYASINLGSVTVISDSTVNLFGVGNTLTIGTVAGGGHNLTLAAADLVLNGNISNLASLTIQNIDAAGTITLMGVGGLALSQTEWSFIQSNVSGVVLGSTANTGTITVAGSWINNRVLDMRFQDGGSGRLNVDGNITGTGTFMVHGSGSTTVLSASITQAAITILDAVEVDGANIVLTTSAGNINIDSTGFAAGISSTSAGNNLSLITQDVGATITVVGDFTSNGGAFVNNVSLAGTVTNATVATMAASGEITGVLQVSLANTLNLNTDSGSAAANVFTAGSVNVAGSVETILLANSELVTSGDIYFGGTLNGNVGGESLALTAGAGDITFVGGVGAVGRLGAITITSANDVTAGAITAVSLQQVAGTGTTTFNDVIDLTGALSVNCGIDVGDTITFAGTVGSVRAASVNLNTGASSVLASPATMATIVAMSDIEFICDNFAMGQNHKLTSLGSVSIFGLTGMNASSVSIGDVTAIGDFRVDADSITLLGRNAGPIITSTGGTVIDPMVDYVVGGKVYFSVAPIMGGSNPGNRAEFSNPTGNVDGLGTLSLYSQVTYPTTITIGLLIGVGGEVLDLSATGGPILRYGNPANVIPPMMSILPPIGLLGDAETLDDDEKNDAQKSGGKSDESQAPATTQLKKTERDVPVNVNAVAVPLASR